MIAVLGGLVAAFAFGISTLAYSRATRLLTPAVVLAWVMLIGAVIVVPGILLFGLPATFTSDSLLWLALVGIGNVGGLLLTFTALRSAQVGIVATIVSTEGAIAAVFAVIAGEPLPVAVAIALGIIVAGVVLTTVVPGGWTPCKRHPRGARRCSRPALRSCSALDSMRPGAWATVSR